MAAAPAPAAPPLVLDAHADTLDHVVRAVARSGFLPQAARLMLASPEHLHDPELLYRTRGVRGAGGRTLLMRAVMRLDVARAAEILGACPTPASRVELLACVDSHGCVALHLACSRRQLNEEAALRMVELLLACGADPLAPTRHHSGYTGWHAIHFAAQWSTQLVQRLVQAGASIDGDVKRIPTLWAAALACTAQGVRMIPRLVALGACETRGRMAMLHQFASNPVEGAQPTDGEVVAALNALVSLGCSLTESMYGNSALGYAAEAGNAPVVRTLLLLGTPATSSGLECAVKHPEMVRLLLAAGAPVDALCNQGVARPACTPLMAAAYESALESVEVLLAAGASVDLSNGNGFTALLYAVVGSTFDPRVTEALLASGADVNARENDGGTALHYLARVQAQKPWASGAAQLLLQRGANARAVNNAGHMPAQCVPVAQHGGELHRLLLEAAAA